MEQHAEVLIGGKWRQLIPSWRDAIAMLLVLAVIVVLGSYVHQMKASFVVARQPEISLLPSALPLYALLTTMRMLVALAASLIFTFVYAIPAAKSRRAEIVLIPLLDVLQSVPILGYLSFTVVFFISLFPGSSLGPELATIFAIFTSEAWNMTFSFYQSLKTIPRDLDDASRSLRLSTWQRFWKLEAPFAVPGLVWNMMMSMSGGWFFVVAAEAISVGSVRIALPGIGSYIALAIQERNLAAVGWAILAMTVTILLYDQLLFRPLVAWADRFRFEMTAAQVVPRSWALDLFRQARLLKIVSTPVTRGLQTVIRYRFALQPRIRLRHFIVLPRRVGDFAWLALLASGVTFAGWKLAKVSALQLSWSDVTTVIGNGMLTLVRVVSLIALATVVWVPIGVAVGSRPKLAEKVQPVAQFLAAFPANLLFPIATFLIVRFTLAPTIWLSPLMILGTQWYILFNVIAGASAFPSDLRETAASFRIKKWRWWRQVMLPGIFPYYVTGAITAAGGAWNASIVSEVVSWGSTKLNGGGLGAYIAQMTEVGDYSRIGLGIAVMSVFVISMNRLIWRPLYRFAERRTRLD